MKDENYIVISIVSDPSLDINDHLLFIKLKKEFSKIIDQRSDFINVDGTYYKDISKYCTHAFICDVDSLCEDIFSDNNDDIKNFNEKYFELSNLHKIILQSIINKNNDSGNIYHIPNINIIKKYLRDVVGLSLQKFTTYIEYNDEISENLMQFVLKYDIFESDFGVENNISIYSNMFSTKLINDSLNPQLFLVTN